MHRFQQNREALGSMATLTIVTQNNNEDQAFISLWKTIDEFENRFSRFKSNSELSHFNQSAGTTTRITWQFSDLLSAAKKWGIKTGGIYNPFILPSLQKAGYKGSWPTPEKFNKQLDYSKRILHKVEEIKIDNDWATIPKNSAIDFGGCGKGYLLDILAEQLDDVSINNYWLSLGGDIVCSGRDVTGENWQIGVQDALEEKIIDSFTNPNGNRIAIATSGVTKRKGVVGKSTWNHIIDPTTSLPVVNDILTVSLEASKCLDADILAKSLLIIGPKQMAKFIEKMRISKAIIQISSKTTGLEVERLGIVG